MSSSIEGPAGIRLYETPQLIITTWHGCNYNRQQSYKICFLWFHITLISNGCSNVIFATDIHVCTTDTSQKGQQEIVFATDIQLINSQKDHN